MRALNDLLEADSLLNDELCSLLASEAHEHATEDATIYEQRGVIVDHRIRRAKWAAVSQTHLLQIQPIFESLISTLSVAFSVTLKRFQEPHLIRYEAGDFHRVHLDSPADVTNDDQARVSCIIFLNTQGGGENHFDGGNLVFYDLSRNRSVGCRIIRPVMGKLVAFHSFLPHEVLPVLRGERYTLATWYS